MNSWGLFLRQTSQGGRGTRKHSSLTANSFGQISNLLATAPEIAAISKLQAGSLVGTAQPITQNVALAGQERGGNALGLQPVNQTWFA